MRGQGTPQPSAAPCPAPWGLGARGKAARGASHPPGREMGLAAPISQVGRLKNSNQWIAWGSRGAGGDRELAAEETCPRPLSPRVPVCQGCPAAALGRAAPSCPPLLCPQILALLPSCCREGAGNSPTLPQRVEGKLAGNKLRPKGQPALVNSSPRCSMPAALGMKAGLCYTSPFLKSPGRLFGVPCMGPARQQAPSPLTLLLQAPPMRTPSSLSTSQLSAKEAPQ